jgi:hypothetical protein
MFFKKMVLRSKLE